MTPSERVDIARPGSVSLPAGRLRTVRFVLREDERIPVEQTLCVAERFRRGVMGLYRRRQLDRARPDGHVAASVLPMSPIFSGKDSRDNPLTGHRHAFFLPVDEDADGLIEHLTVFCTAGFDGPELDALTNLRWLSFSPDRRLRVDLTGMGDLSELSTVLAAESTVWVSATPFVASRHPKRRGSRRDRPELLEVGRLTDFVTEVLLEEVGRLRVQRPDLPPPKTVSPILDDDGMYCIPAGRIQARAFTRARQRHGANDKRRPFGTFRIVFPQPVRGPICLGRSCHFGLGLFVPEMWPPG